MTSLLAATFPLESGRRIARRLDAFHSRPLTVLDAAVVDWCTTEPRPATWQARPLDDRRALSGAFWGHLFAHLILLPLSHVEETTSSRINIFDQEDASFRHLGLNPQPLGDLRAAMKPGTVTIFVLHDDAQDISALEAPDAGQIFGAKVALTSIEERRLYAGFGEPSAASPR